MKKHLILTMVLTVIAASALFAQSNYTEDKEYVKQWIQDHPDVKLIPMEMYNQYTPGEKTEIDALKKKIVYTERLTKADITTYTQAINSTTPSSSDNGTPKNNSEDEKTTKSLDKLEEKKEKETAPKEELNVAQWLKENPDVKFVTFNDFQNADQDLKMYYISINAIIVEGEDVSKEDIEKYIQSKPNLDEKK